MNDGKLVISKFLTHARRIRCIWVGNTADSTLTLGQLQARRAAKLPIFVGGDCIIFDDSALSTDTSTCPPTSYPAKNRGLTTPKSSNNIQRRRISSAILIERRTEPARDTQNTSDFTGTATINGGTK